MVAKNAKERRLEEAEREWWNAVSVLAKLHGAVTDWEEGIAERGWFPGAFTIDVSRALIRSNRQPVLLMMDLQDVAEKNGTFTAQFSKSVSTNYLFDLHLEVKCTEEQATNLLRVEKNAFLSYAVIARIDEVSRPRFEVVGTLESESAGVELNYSPHVLFAKGACVDFLRKKVAAPTHE